MSDPLQLARLSVKPRAIESFTVPPMPKMPAWVISKFNLSGWENEMENWRQNLQTGIREALVSIKSQS